ncbi:MAG: recombinase family protein [Planctomycetota bacterium]
MWLYGRKSVEEGDACGSTRTQIEQLRRFAEEHGLVVNHAYEEQVSASDFDRPVFEAMLARLEAMTATDRPRAVLFVTFNRFCRADHVELGRCLGRMRDVSVRPIWMSAPDLDAFADDTLTQMRLALEGGAARQDLHQIAEAVLPKQLAYAADGFEQNGARKFGYRIVFERLSGGEVVETIDAVSPAGTRLPKPRPAREWALVRRAMEPEAGVVKEIFRMCLDGGTPRSIAANLNERRIPGPSGNGWASSTVHTMLRDRRYAGSLVYAESSKGKFRRVVDGEVVRTTHDMPAEVRNSKPVVRDGRHDALVTMDEFEAAQERLDQRRKARTGGRRPVRQLLLQHMLVCSACGRKMTPCPKKRGGSNRVQYQCQTYDRYGRRRSPGHEGCSRFVVEEAPVLAAVARALSSLLDRQMVELRAALEKVAPERRTASAAALEAKQLQAATVKARRDLARMERIFAVTEDVAQRAVLWDQRQRLAIELSDLEARVEAVAVRPKGDLRAMTEAAVQMRMDGVKALHEPESASLKVIRATLSEFVSGVRLKMEREERRGSPTRIVNTDILLHPAAVILDTDGDNPYSWPDDDPDPPSTPDLQSTETVHSGEPGV